MSSAIVSWTADGLKISVGIPMGTWIITDPVMDEQPTRAEVEAERAATKARVALSRATKGGDKAAIAIARKADEEAKEAVRAAKAGRTARPEAVPVTPGVTPSVTPGVTGYVTPAVTLPRPDPTRPGATTSLSGSGGEACDDDPLRPDDGPGSRFPPFEAVVTSAGRNGR